MSELQFQNIPLKDITPDPNQPRKFYDDTAMQELAESVRESGVLQPILVRKKPKGKGYLLVCGERRYRASITVMGVISDRNTIPAVIRELSDEEALQLQIVENLQRKDVHPMEEAVGFKSFIEGKNWGFDEIAKRVGKSEYYVKQRIKLNDLLDQFQQMFFRNQMDIATALDIARTDKTIQEQILEDFVDEDDLQDAKFQLKIGDWQWKKYKANLDNAPFDVEDRFLNKSMGACTSCQFNSSVSKLFPEGNGNTTCSNIKCYKEKANRSFELNLQLAQEDPAVVIITTEYNPDKETKELMKKVDGIIERGGFEVEEAPEFPERDWYDGNNDTDEEDEAEFQEAIKEYHDDLEKWNKKVASGGYIKAFVAGGDEKGKFTYVKLKKTTVEKNKSASAAVSASTSDEVTIEEIDNEIARIKEKEKRSKQIDENKIWEDLKKHFNPHGNASVLKGKLTPLERKAISTSMYNKLNYSTKDDFRKLFKIDGRKAEFPDMDETTFNQMCRFFMLDILPPAMCYSGFTDDANLSLEIAKEYFPGVLLEIQDNANLKTEKRIARIEKRIKELQDQKKELKATQPKPAKAKK